MRIILVTAEYGKIGGGLSSACFNFYNFLSKSLGYKVFLISSGSEVNMVAQGGYNSELTFAVQNEYKLKDYIFLYLNKNIDVVIGFGGSFNCYFASIIANRINVRFVSMFRGTDINLSKWDAQNTFHIREVVNSSYRVFCLSNEMKANIMHISKTFEDKIIVLPNAVDFNINKVNFPNLYDKIIIGTAAYHINEKKGIANLLCMIFEFKKIAKISIQLDIVGKIDEDLKNNYVSIIRNLNLQENINFLGYLSRDQYHNIIQDWDFYIQTSICEGFGNSVIEAIANSKGVILSPTGYISEKLKNNFSCILFENWNPKSMSKKLKFLIEMEEKSQYYVDAYKELSLSMSVDLIEKRWTDFFDNILEYKNVDLFRSYGILSVIFHDIDESNYDHITTPKNDFRNFVEKIYSKGLGMCSMKSYMNKKEEDRNKWIVCTFDDAYLNLINNALPILKQYGFSATVFVNTSLIGCDNSWNWKDSKKRYHLDIDNLLYLNSEGWEIASHGHTHRNFLRLSEDEVVEEFYTSKSILDNIVGYSETFAFPYGNSTSFIRKICGNYYKNAFSLNEGGTELVVDHLQIKRYSMDEVCKILGL